MLRRSSALEAGPSGSAVAEEIDPSSARGPPFDMPLQLSDDLFDSFAPRAAYEHVLHPDFRVPGAKEPLVLLLRFAGRGSDYMKAMAKLKPEKDERVATERAARMFARHSVTGWKNACEVDGTPAPFAAKDLGEILCKFVAADRSDVVDRAIRQALDPDNFRTPIVEAKDLGEG